MPFVKQTRSKGIQPPTAIRKLFIGRTNELSFFVENILQPEEPAHNIISISGQGGVGKSTLLTRFIDETKTVNFKDYCLTALVDERQITPASILERFADQLRMRGEFEEALAHYKEALRKLQIERDVARDTLWRKTATNVASSVAKDVPIVGGILEQGAGLAVEYFFDQLHYRQLLKDAERLEDPISDLTNAFVVELNRLTEVHVSLDSNRTKHRQRVMLFFDTFEQLAGEIAPWLLNYFLQTNIDTNVVLVVAGRDPIDRSIPDNPKGWLPYYDDNTIYSISLNNFTEEETRAYLIKRGITAPSRIATIWQLSKGLPLYLSLLTSNPQGEVDPTADVVANFLRWIPEQEQVKRQLILDAALLFRPFNQDELWAFAYLPEHERPTLYRWLIAQPFVRSNLQDGRYSYHELAQELFSRYLYQRSKKEYYATRRALADYYRSLLEDAETEGGKEAYGSAEWLELVLALAYQLFLLPDKFSHIKAIEQILNAYEHSDQTGEILRILRELSQEQPSNQTNKGARQTIKQLLQYFEADTETQEFLTAGSYLLGEVAREPSFSEELLASIYSNRGNAYYSLKDYQRAFADYDRAIAMNPSNADFYNRRGIAYHSLKDYQRAFADYIRSIALNPNMKLRIPDALPILPVKKTIVYPSTITFMEIEQESALRLLNDVKDGNQLLVVAAQKFADREPTKLDDLFRVGTVARLAQMGRKPEGKFQIVLLGLERVMIGELTQEHPYFVARIALKPDIQEERDKTEAMVRQVIPSFKTLIALSQKMPESVIGPRLGAKEPREIVYTMAFLTGMDLEQGQHLLETDAISARIGSLGSYLTTELDKFERNRQASYKNSQSPRADELAVALDAFNAADTWDETVRVLEARQQVLLSEEALNVLRSRIATSWQRQAPSHWIFRLEHDLEFLEDALAHGMNVAKQHLEGRIQMLQNQQEVLEVFKTLATVNTPEDILEILAQQQIHPFSPATFNVLRMLFEQVAAQNPERGEQLQLLLSLLEEGRDHGVDSAVESFMKRVKPDPDFKREFDHANEVLGRYLTSTTFEEAYQTLKEKQEVLLSDLVRDMIEQDVALLHKAGEHQTALKLELQLYLFEDARVHGVDTAWQAFVEALEKSGHFRT
jgi:Lon protease-like protein